MVDAALPVILDNDPKTGRFVKGKKGGPGRPKGNSAEHWNGLFRVKCGRDFKRLYYALLNKALQGDTKAITYMLDRLMGKQGETLTVKTEQEVKNPDELRAEFDRLFRGKNVN